MKLVSHQQIFKQECHDSPGQFSAAMHVPSWKTGVSEGHWHWGTQGTLQGVGLSTVSQVCSHPPQSVHTWPPVQSVREMVWLVHKRYVAS